MHVSLVPALETDMVPQETGLGIHAQTRGHSLATRNLDPRIGQYAAVISGEMKGWQGRLVRLTNTTATIECAGGRQIPTITSPLKDFVLL
jgi:hypothetical protein